MVQKKLQRLVPVWLVVSLASALSAQEFRATISGRVTDSQNASVAAARITAVQIDTAAKFEAVSDSEGNYTIPFLPPSTYRLTAEAAGFKRYAREKVAANSNERLGIDIELALGEITETISITGDAPILETASASTGQV